MSMAPLIVVKPTHYGFLKNLTRLDRLTVNGKPIEHHITSSGDVRFSIGLINQDELVVIDGNERIEPSQIGIDNVFLQDAAGSYAYHIPEGILLHYNAAKRKENAFKEQWRPISVLDVAPSLLKKFGKNTPGYMVGDTKIFST